MHAYTYTRDVLIYQYVLVSATDSLDLTNIILDQLTDPIRYSLENVCN